jgi:hypothetical protein
MRSDRRKMRAVQDYKASVGCDCGETDPRALDLHHRDGDKHKALISRRVDGTSRNGGNKWSSMKWQEIVEEIERCDVLCANCHRKVTFAPPKDAVRLRFSGKEAAARAALGI